MKILNFSTYYIVAIALLFFTNCQEEEKLDVRIIPKDKLLKILTEIQLLESHATIPSIHQPTVKDSLDLYYNGIFLKYEVNRADFYYSMKEYAKNPNIMTEVYELMIEELKAKELLFENIDVTTEAPIMAFSIQQLSEIIYQTPLAEILRTEDTISIDSFRDSLFVFIDKNDSLLQSFGVNNNSFKYSFVINTTQSILFDQLKQQLKVLHEIDSSLTKKSNQKLLKNLKNK
jgi:hypothetical protein